MVVRVLEEARVDLHLPREHRLQVIGHVVPGRDLSRALGELGLGRNDAELLLARKRPLPERVPAVVELPFVLIRPFRAHVVRGMGRARREVREEGLVGHERLLLADPADRPVGHVLGEVVALLGSRLRLDRNGPS